MIYYTEDLKEMIIDFNEIQKDIIDDTGSQGIIYKYNDNECIKLYFEEQPRGLKIYTKKQFENFKKLGLENYCELHKEFYREPTLKTIGAFTMKLYQKSDISFLDMPIEYILYNFEIQYKNAEILSENKIIMHDLHKKNVIIGDDNMTIIDFESYYKERLLTYKTILRKNTLILLKLMKSLYLEELKKRNLNNEKSTLLLDDLFSYSEEPVKKLSKQLTGIKKSIDLF